MKVFVVAAPCSNSGKTSISLGLMRAFTNRGLKVQPFKVGPDFIDPLHHESAISLQNDTINNTPRRSINLDGWMLKREETISTFWRNAKDADICIIEGVMGLFDGKDGKTEHGSTAEIAKWLNVPVILVIDCWAMSRSVAALLKGFVEFDKELRVEAVIFNRVGGDVHTAWLREAVESSVVGSSSAVKILGGIPKSDHVAVPERHLGLLLPSDFAKDGSGDGYISKLAELVEKHLNLNTILELSTFDPPIEIELQNNPASSLQTQQFLNGGPKIRIGVAKDEAFCFYYRDNERLLMSQPNVEIVHFSPLHDNSLPEDLDGLYFGGGYPEIYARELEANTEFRDSVNRLLGDGGKGVYAECGGLMYLSKGIFTQVDGDNDVQRYFEMVGILSIKTRMVKRMKMGYVSVKVREKQGNWELRGDALFEPGLECRGHVFHFSEVVESSEKTTDEEFVCAYEMTMTAAKSGQETTLDGYHLLIPSRDGSATSTVLASYVHLHWGSNPEFASSFVRFLQKNKRNKQQMN
ncbi:hypothetical protein HK098_003395 [Nowakowskiella sp. JEL0407]|nr:hypothetical protein HK098_003395 [Nowakowskiella sp. JEL0407]